MKIAIVGVPGTGKSTLCKRIAESTDLELITEVENDILIEEGYSSWRQLRDYRGTRGMIDLFFLSLDRKKQFETKREHFVADKTVIDYGARWFSRMWEGATAEEHNRVREALGEASKDNRYDKIIYLPLNSKIEVFRNTERTADFNERYQRNLLIQGIALEYGFKMEAYDFLFSDSNEKVLKDLKLESFKRSK